jgi:hypothetical protein
VERFNASMAVQISRLQQQQHSNWDDHLDSVVFAYTNSQQKTTKHSPIQLVFGRAPILPIDKPTRYFSFLRSSDPFVHLQKVFRSYHHAAKVNIVHQQQSNKKRYDCNRTDPHYKVGDHAFIRIFTGHGKLDPRFSLSPKGIVKTNHPHYIVRHELTGLEHTYHVADLRPVVSTFNDDSTM